MTTFDEVLSLLKEGKTVELKFYLSCGLFSRHQLSLDEGKIYDFSYVDSSFSTIRIEEYKRSFHGRAFISNSVELEEVYDDEGQTINEKGIHSMNINWNAIFAIVEIVLAAIKKAFEIIKKR